MFHFWFQNYLVHTTQAKKKAQNTYNNQTDITVLSLNEYTADQSLK